MRNLLSGLFALILMLATAHAPATAGSDTVTYQPGAVQAAIAKGETVLIHYKSNW